MVLQYGILVWWWQCKQPHRHIVSFLMPISHRPFAVSVPLRHATSTRYLSTLLNLNLTTSLSLQRWWLRFMPCHAMPCDAVAMRSHAVWCLQVWSRSSHELVRVLHDSRDRCDSFDRHDLFSSSWSTGSRHGVQALVSLLGLCWVDCDLYSCYCFCHF